MPKTNNGLELPESLTVPVYRAESEVTVNLADITPAGLVYILQYGLKQSLNDAANKKDESAEANLALALKRLDKIKAGTISVRDASRTDEIDRELAGLVIAWLTTKGLKKGEAVKAIADGPETAVAIVAAKFLAGKKGVATDVVHHLHNDELNTMVTAKMAEFSAKAAEIVAMKAAPADIEF